ncbi:MAG: histidinol-phosphate transaminase [Rhizobiaceae bacterium]
MPQPKPGVMNIAMYVPGKSKVPEGVKLHKLSSNESPLGPSEDAIDAALNATHHMQDYPDGSSTMLRNAIANSHGLNVDNIICGNGSDEILGLLATTYLANGDEAIFTEHGFLVYRIATLSAGGVPVVVKEQECKADVDAILAAVTEKTRLIFLANPNNPTGTYLPIEEMRRLHAGLPSNIILVVDAAYAEYVRRNDYESGIELVSGNSNVIMTRTFSKIFGLAALRIGWAYGPREIIDALNRVRGPFNVNAAAIAAGTAAIGDKSHVEKSIEHNEEWLTKVSEGLAKLGLKVTPSVGNFVLVHFPDDPGKTAAEADEFLTKRGFVLRAVNGYGFPNSLRMSIGTAEANLGTLSALKEFLG